MAPKAFDALLDGAFPQSAALRLNGSRGPWLLRHDAGDGADVSILVDGGWASLHRHAPSTVGPSALDAVAVQSGWPGGVKWAALRPLPVLRADVPLLADTAAGRDWVTRQLRAASAGLQAAAAPGVPPEPSPEPAEWSAEPELIAYTCTAAGWSAVVKSEGTVRIDLQVRGVPRSVLLRACGGGIRASVALSASTLARANEPCRGAVGAFLLRAAAALRWARAFVSADDGQLVGLGFECFVAAPFDEHALLLAVDTLIAACELFGCEAEALLEHPDMASLYLQCLPGIARDAEDDSPSVGAAPMATAPIHAALAALD